MSRSRIFADSGMGVLLAVADVLASRSATRRFHEADLVIRAWQADPERFGLPGRPEHPDARRVAACLLGRRGLIRRGFLRRLAGGQIEVSRMEVAA